MTVLVVEDDEITREAVSQYLRLSGFNVLEAESGEKALDLSRKVDVALVDVKLPGMSGIELVSEIKSRNLSCVVFIVTAYDDTETVKKSVEAGADDFIKKPVNLELLKLKITHALRNRVFHLYRNSYLKSLKKKLSLLEKTAEEFFTEYEDFLFEVLDILNMLSEYRDAETHKHTERVGWLSGRIAEEMGMDEAFVTEIQFAAPLHDIGKIGIPDRILLKPGILTPEEFEIMKTTHHHWIQDPQSKFFSHPSTWSGDCPHAPRKMERLRISERSQGKGNTTFWSHSGGGGQLRCDGVQKTVQKTKNAGRGLSGNRRTIRKALLSRSCESLFETGKRNYGCLQEGRR